MKVAACIIAAGYGSLRQTSDGAPVSKLLEFVSGVPMFIRPIQSLDPVRVEHAIVVANPLYEEQVHHAMHAAKRECHISRIAWSIEIQHDRCGAGDAVRCALPALRRRGSTHALVAYGDMPLWSPRTMWELLDAAHADPEAAITMTTVDRDPAYPELDRYGRIVRDEYGNIARVVEVTDPKITETERQAETVNPSLWVFDVGWLEKNIGRVKPVERGDGRAKERHLPPLVALAYADGKKVREYRLPAESRREALGVNTLSELERVRTLARPECCR